MNAINADVKDVMEDISRTRQELQQAEQMMRFAEPEFVDSQYLLIESLKCRLGALIRTAQKLKGAI